jgi:hypothetical protein
MELSTVYNVDTAAFNANSEVKVGDKYNESY